MSREPPTVRSSLVLTIVQVLHCQLEQAEGGLGVLLFIRGGGCAGPLVEGVQRLVPGQLQAPAVASVVRGDNEVSRQPRVPFCEKILCHSVTTPAPGHSPESTSRLVQPLRPAARPNSPVNTSQTGPAISRQCQWQEWNEEDKHYLTLLPLLHSALPLI